MLPAGKRAMIAFLDLTNYPENAINFHRIDDRPLKTRLCVSAREREREGEVRARKINSAPRWMFMFADWQTNPINVLPTYKQETYLA